MSDEVEFENEKGYSSRTFWLILLSIKIIIVGGILALIFIPKSGGDNGLHFSEVNGLGYTTKGSLIMPVKTGLALYNNGNWSKTASDQNHYSAFAIVKDGFYGSGTSAQAKHPLGIVKGTGNGNHTIPVNAKLNTSFDFIGAGYYTNALYVENARPNAVMKQQGLYYSLDKGKTWTNAKASGLKGKISAITVDPKKKNVVAIGTDKGVFYSMDYGHSFKQFMKGQSVTALSFGFNHELIVATYDGKSALNRLDPQNGGTTYSIDLSSVEREPILFVSENPNNVRQLVIVIRNKDVFYSNTMGANWTYLAKGGKGLKGA